jgi:uncharacterized membrane protein
MSKPNTDNTIHAGSLYEQSAFINVSNPGRLSSALVGALLLRNSVNGWMDRSAGNSLLRLAAASYLLYRGVSGNCPISAAMGQQGKHNRSVNIRETFIVNQPRELVYFAWRRLEDLPLFLRHVKEITLRDDTHSHWVIDTPGHLPVIEWDAEIVEDSEGEMMSWRSLPGSSIETAGKVVLMDFPGNATQVRIMISYRPPAGYIGSTLAKLLTPTFERMVQEDIGNFKEYMESFRPEILL